MFHPSEFLTIVIAHALAVISPGPDFAIVIRQSLHHGRRTACWTSVGIGCGLLVHIAYTLLGLGLLLRNSTVALETVRWLGAAYLAWLGVQALRSRARTADIDVGRGLASAPTVDTANPGTFSAWSTGFLVNLFNPKAALFFVSLFPLAVSAATPRIVQVGYGAWMTVTTIGWFCLVATVFTRESVRRAFLRHGHWIDRALGVVFLGFAASLALATLR